MSKKRVYEYAKENNMASKELLKKAKENGLVFKSHMSSMNEEEMKKMDAVLAGERADHSKAKSQSKPKKAKNKDQQQDKPAKNKNKKNKGQEKSRGKQQKKKGRQQRQGKRKQKRTPNYNDRKKVTNNKPHHHKNKALPEKVEYVDGMTVADLSKKLHRQPAELIKKLMMMGVMANQNQSLDTDTIALLLDEYGIEAEEKIVVNQADFDQHFQDVEEDTEHLAPRPAVVTVMGHVDHGKTTLLDYLRKANVAGGEAGGITQHIAAYQIEVNGKLLTFLDTPGHAAFTTMRARGADVTDIVIIVVAADDGVMPQTVEAINHAKAAKVPILVAINKMDKPTADPDRVKQELMEYGLVSEEWGGDTIFVEISAKKGENIDELLEMLLLVAELEEYKANPDRLALGSVIEARLDPHRGAVATLLVQHGTLKVSDAIVVGNTYGRVRTMVNDQGKKIEAAGPSSPVEITGLNDAPSAGDRFVVFEDEKTARSVGEERAEKAQEERRQATTHVTLDNLFDTIKEGQMKTVNVIIKADVQGSVEALAGSLKKIKSDDVKVDIVHQAVGGINESDVTLASASNAIIIGFNVRPTPQAKVQAQTEGVDIRLHNVIYDAIQEIENAMLGLLDPEIEEQVTGEVVIRETYKVSKVGTIGGAYVNSGVIKRNSKVRVFRNNVSIYEGELASLKRYKDDASEVTKGYECGLMIKDFNDIKVDDIIEPYELVEVKQF